MADVLLVERGGTRWGVEQCRVSAVTSRAHGVTVTVDGGRVWADRVLGVARAIELHPTGRVLERFWPVPALGLAVCEGHPVVMINPRALPDFLARPREGDEDEGGTR